MRSAPWTRRGVGEARAATLQLKALLVHCPSSTGRCRMLGLQWFAGFLVAWIRSRGNIGVVGLWLARAGVAASFFYSGVLAARGFVCPYCIAVHVANVAFYVVLETRARSDEPSRRTVILPVLVTVGVLTLALALLKAQFAGEAKARAERELGATTAELKAASPDAANAFTGRHRRGPQDARARVVVFTDYQCEDCHKFEGELSA